MQKPDWICGLGVRPTNVKSFVAKGQLNGKGVLKTLGSVGIMTQDEARQAAREVFRDIGAGVHPHQRKCLGDVAEPDARRLPGGQRPPPRTKTEYGDLVARYVADWRDMKDITREMVEARHLAIGKEVEVKYRRQAEQHAKIHLERANKIETQYPEALRCNAFSIDLSIAGSPCPSETRASRGL